MRNFLRELLVHECQISDILTDETTKVS